MNKERRNRLKEVKEKIAEILCTIEEVRDEEEAAYDNLPESLQNGERGELMYNNVDTLQEIYENLESLPNDIDELIG